MPSCVHWYPYRLSVFPPAEPTDCFVEDNYLSDGALPLTELQWQSNREQADGNPVPLSTPSVIKKRSCHVADVEFEETAVKGVFVRYS